MRSIPMILTAFLLTSTVACDLAKTDYDTGVSDLDDVDGDSDEDADEAAEESSGGNGEDGGDGGDGGSEGDADNDGYTSVAGDCDDTDPFTYPGADETCDDDDNDCDGVVDEDAKDGTASWLDDDGDGFGNSATYAVRCDEGVTNGADCDDGDATEPHYVVDGASGASDGSVLRPWPTIQDGIDNARECVAVEAGSYTENVDFGGRDVMVTGLGGAAETVIDGNSRGPVVSFASGEGSGAVLTGFTLTGGSGFEEESSSSYSCGSGDTCTDYYTTWCGGGLYIDGSNPTLSDLVVEDNVVYAPADSTSGDDTYTYLGYGGGACVRNANVTFTGVTFADNSGDEGGAVYIESTGSAAFEQSSFVGNTGESGGAVQVDGGAVSLTNVLLAWNEADLAGGGLLVADGTATLTNVTLGGNSSAQGGGLYLSGSSVGSVENTIVYGSTGEGVKVDGGSSYSGSYSNVYGNSGGQYEGTTDVTGTSGNLSSDPDFSSVSSDGNPNNDNWGLAPMSPSKDAGNPAPAMNDEDGSRNDQGAYGGPDGSWL